MRRLLVIWMLFCSLCLAQGATKRALLIGIGAYPQDKDNFWNPIHGDNDVPLIKGVLLQNGFEASNISTLVNEQATYKGIQRALARLINEASVCDTVYIHFSGHGQLITDLNGDEPSGYDEAWIPYDALQVPSKNYHGQNHFVDDELNAYLHRLRAKVGPLGRIVVVADACHSAGGSRTYDEEVIRGTTARFELSNRPRRNYSVPNTEDWIFLSACSSEGFNRQCNVDDEWHGSLSYAIYLLSDQLRIVSAEELRSMIENTMYNLLHRTQTPVLDGPVSQIVIPIL